MVRGSSWASFGPLSCTSAEREMHSESLLLSLPQRRAPKQRGGKVLSGCSLSQCENMLTLLLKEVWAGLESPAAI